MKKNIIVHIEEKFDNDKWELKISVVNGKFNLFTIGRDNLGTTIPAIYIPFYEIQTKDELLRFQGVLDDMIVEMEKVEQGDRT